MPRTVSLELLFGHHDHHHEKSPTYYPSHFLRSLMTAPVTRNRLAGIETNKKKVTNNKT